MRPDVLELRDFYATPLGRMAAQLLRGAIAKYTPVDSERSLLLMGYGLPFLEAAPQAHQSVIACMPDAQGALRWPDAAPNRALLADEFALPFENGCFDHVLLAHSLEFIDRPLILLREIWRVLIPGGRLIIIAPNRAGLWARMEKTPFGTGRPYSRQQLAQVLSDAQLSPRQWCQALYMPPFSHSMFISAMSGCEKMGRIMWPRAGGVHLVEAEKVIYAGRAIRAEKKSAEPVPAMRPALPKTTVPRSPHG